jgi:hypothetical protein
VCSFAHRSDAASAASSSWDVNVEAAIPLEDAAHAAEDQVISPMLFFWSRIIVTRMLLS